MGGHTQYSGFKSWIFIWYYQTYQKNSFEVNINANIEQPINIWNFQWRPGIVSAGQYFLERRFLFLKAFAKTHLLVISEVGA